MLVKDKSKVKGEIYWLKEITKIFFKNTKNTQDIYIKIKDDCIIIKNNDYYVKIYTDLFYYMEYNHAVLEIQDFLFLIQIIERDLDSSMQFGLKYIDNVCTKRNKKLDNSVFFEENLLEYKSNEDYIINDHNQIREIFEIIDSFITTQKVGAEAEKEINNKLYINGNSIIISNGNMVLSKNNVFLNNKIKFVLYHNIIYSISNLLRTRELYIKVNDVVTKCFIGDKIIIYHSTQKEYPEYSVLFNKKGNFYLYIGIYDFFKYIEDVINKYNDKEMIPIVLKINNGNICVDVIDNLKQEKGERIFYSFQHNNNSNIKKYYFFDAKKLYPILHYFNKNEKDDFIEWEFFLDSNIPSILRHKEKVALIMPLLLKK